MQNGHLGKIAMMNAGSHEMYLLFIRA